MATAAKHLFSSLHHHHRSSPSSSSTRRSSTKQEDSDTYNKRKEEEKHFIAQWEAGSQKTPLTPSEISKDPGQKHVGHSSKHLKCDDFKLLKILGTGAISSGRRMAVNYLHCSRHIRKSMAGKIGKAWEWRWRNSLCAQSLEEDGW